MIPLPAGQVHLWACRTDLAGDELERRRSVLDDRERARALRFRDRRHGAAYVAAHGWLRRVLAAYAGIAARELRFGEGEFGKPALMQTGSPLQFSLSHAGSLAIVAVSPGFSVGVDIETVRDIDLDICASFAPGEARALADLPDAWRADGFACCWTRKEAYLKALGTGLSTELTSFEVSVDPRNPARLLSVAGRPGEAEHWTIVDLDPAPGHRGALAARRIGWSAIWMARPEGLGLTARPTATAAR